MTVHASSAIEELGSTVVTLLDVDNAVDAAVVESEVGVG